MTSVKDIALIIAVVVGSIVLVSLAVLVLLRSMSGKLRARVEAQLPAESIVLADWFANSFGVQSRGVTQLRGNGALVLTRDALHFFMMVTHNDLRIPLASITGISFVSSHLGKTVGRTLLAIDFSNDVNAPDRVALLVRQPELWMQTLPGDRRPQA